METGTLSHLGVILITAFRIIESEVLEPSRPLIATALGILQRQGGRRDRRSHSLLCTDHPRRLKILLPLAYPLSAQTGGEAQPEQVQGLPNSTVALQARPNSHHVLDLLNQVQQPARDGHQPTDRPQG